MKTLGVFAGVLLSIAGFSSAVHAEESSQDVKVAVSLPTVEKPEAAVSVTAPQLPVVPQDPKVQQILNQAKALSTPVEQENLILARAKTFLGENNYQAAISLAAYVLSNLDANSLGAKGLMETAKAALAKAAQDKLSQMGQSIGGGTQNAQADGSAVQQQSAQTHESIKKAASDVKSLFGGSTTK
jgi:hypothetical protein